MENNKLMKINPANLVPENERAVEGTAIDINSASNVDVVLVKAPKDIVCEEERAVVMANHGSNEFEIANKLGLITSVSGMGNLKGVFGDRVYAHIIENENGERYIEFCEQYENGQYTPRFKIAQDDLIMAAKCGFQPQTISKESSLAHIKSGVIKFMTKLEREYYRKHSGNQMHDIVQILITLCGVLNKLPVEKEIPEIDAATFSNSVLETIDRYIFNDFQHKSYYALCDDEIHTIAEHLEMKRIELLKRLKQYGLLYLTPSSMGYKTNVRLKCYGSTKTYTEWRYCIYNLEYLNTLKEKQMGLEALREKDEPIEL